MTAAIHITPTAPLAERVLLPGDPGRALMLAQTLLYQPRMFNHNRGLWGYTGIASDGDPLTIQSTGMGGPSAAIVLFELAQLGARRVIRVGTCGTLDASLELGALVIAREAMAADGTSAALGAGDRTAADPELLGALVRAGTAPAQTVVSADLFYDDDARRQERWRAAGAVAVEMECAAIYALASKLGLSGAAVLTVSDLLRPQRARIDPNSLRAAERRMGELALRALTG